MSWLIYLFFITGLNLEALKRSTFDCFGPNSAYEDKKNAGYQFNDKHGMYIFLLNIYLPWILYLNSIASF